MKLRLIVLSDLWGFDNAPWIKNYSDVLESADELVFYDSRNLAGMAEVGLNEKEVHSRFINGGMDVAIHKLLELEKGEINILAFSIGGTIAWKAALKGLKINTLFAISSTRLRYETQKPTCSIHLAFGENDDFKPDSSWVEKLNLKIKIHKGGKHELYKDPVEIFKICDWIKIYLNNANKT